MAETPDREQPVISFKHGPTHGFLIQKLAEYARDFADWRMKNRYKSPWQAKTSVEAYKVALVTELIFGPHIKTWDFNEKLARQNNNLADGVNFNQACEEIVELLRFSDTM